jgi:phytoene desaturase
LVIGAGLGGLAVACRLAHAGHSVAVLEKNETVGGKVNLVEAAGFRFDTGASLLTMRHVLEDLFTACGRRLEDYVELVRLDPVCRYSWSDGTIFDASDDIEASVAGLEGFAPDDGDAFRSYLDRSKLRYEIAERTFLAKSLNELSTLLRPSLLPDLLRISSLRTLSSYNSASFRSPKLRQLFDRFATYNGSSPYKVPATFSLISWAEFGLGAWYPKGGMYEISRALGRLAGELGVRVFTKTEVQKMVVRNGRVVGVKAVGETFGAEVVVSNADAVETYRTLLDSQEFQDREPSCSGFVLLLGTNRRFDSLAHHNIFFSDDYKSEFEEIFRHKRPASDPTIYVCASSRTDSTQAPDGCENLFVMVNAPYTSKRTDWQQEMRPYRDFLMTRLEEIGLEGISKSVVYEKVITPADFKVRYRANRGSIYGISSHGMFSAFKRVPNRSKDLENLYFVGGAAHPGGGIPLVLLSAKHTADLILRRAE